MSQKNARAKRSIKNAVVSTAYYLINLLLGFFSRKIFFNHLGSEVLGLGTTARDLIGFLQISELGIGAAVAFLLYKPLFEDDREKIKEIVTVQGWLYQRIAIFIISAACVLMCFFPSIFAKSDLPLGYAYIVFIALLIGVMMSYFFNFRLIVLTARQQQYKIVRVFQSAEIVKILLQIFTVSTFKNPFFWWIGLELATRLVSTLLMDRLIKKEYPWLKLDMKKGKEYLARNKVIIKKTKQVFFHRLAGAALLNSSSPILYAFTSLTTVAFYGNYQIIISKLSRLIGNLFNSTAAGVGDLVAEGNKRSIMRVFWELYDSRFVIAAIIIICSYQLTDPFISSWLSPDYLLGKRFLLLYLILQGIMMTRETVDSFINAHGMFQDIWAPMVEATLNIGLSIVFGSWWGLEGIILGVITSLVIIIEIWKPIFLFKVGFKESVLPYFIKLAGRLVMVMVIAFVVTKVSPLLPMASEAYGSFLKWTIYAIEVTLLTSAILIPSFLAFSEGLRNFFRRMTSIIFNK